jgi:hypothetical protein
MTRAIDVMRRAAARTARIRSALVGWVEPYQSWIDRRAAADAAEAAAPRPPVRPPQPSTPQSPADYRHLLSSVNTHHENCGNRRAGHWRAPTRSRTNGADGSAVRLHIWENEGGATSPAAYGDQPPPSSPLRIAHEICLLPTYLEEPLFTQTNLATLWAHAPRLGASIFMPTHIRGAQIRQGPIRLLNLLTEVYDELTAIGLREAEAEAFIAPAQSLIDDYEFWQHQDQGLALFLDSEGLQQFRVPLPLTEQIVVGPGFHLRPLLPLLVADGRFYILTATAERVRLYTASRFSIAEVHDADLPVNRDADRSEPDYQHASPATRPRAGFAGTGKVWAEGDRPRKWNESRLADFARHTALAVGRRLAAHPQPLIIVADAKTAGQFKKVSGINAFGPLLAGVIPADPESMTPQQLHGAACTLMQEHLDGPRADAEEHLDTLLGRHDPRATDVIGEVVRAAYQGRVETIFLPEDETIWGRYEQDIDQIVTGSEIQQDDLLEAAAVQTLHHGGAVHLLPKTYPTEPQTAAAVLRY